MIENNEFQEIGRTNYYKVPDGFFEQVSEKTLLKAKQRELVRRRKLVLFRTVAVAASLAAVFLLGYFIPNNGIKQKSKPIITANRLVDHQIIQNNEINTQKTSPEIGKTVTELVPLTTIDEATNPEEIDDVLADLSDDELLQLAAMFKTDPFISESAQ